MDVTVAQFDSNLLTIAMILIMVGGWALGWWIGKKHPIAIADVSSRFVDGSLALLGLLLAFTFSMALAKHEQRRLMIIADSNSIADFYTSATLLPEPHRTKLQDATREYVNARLQIARDRASVSNLAKANASALAFHQRLTELTGEALNAGTPIAVPLVNTLNNLTSSHVSLLASFQDRLPVEVLFLLAVAAVASTVLVGRYHDTASRPGIAGMACYILLVALTIHAILDLNQPRHGLIVVSIEPLERLAASIAK